MARTFARRLSDRVELLAAGSRQIASGNLETRIEKDSNDELGDLAQAFNSMAASLDGARAQILAQTNEIMLWNQTLEKRVEDGTRELRQAQDLLLRSRALAALGELGAGVAHEINNPLAGVLGIAQLMLADLPPSHPARSMAQDIEAQALRIRKIVSNLLRFAQRQAGEDAKPLDLSRVLDDAIELCGPSDLAAAGIVVMRRYANPTPAVRGNAVQLQEAFIQLIRNARVAMDRGGKLTLATSVPDDELVRVTIADTGHGISAEHLPRIFDPFFTTKSDWAGIGMGLSVVHKTIEDHGGSIEVESDVDQGTTFMLTFPALAVRGGHPIAMIAARKPRRAGPYPGLALLALVIGGGAGRRQPPLDARSSSARRPRATTAPAATAALLGGARRRRAGGRRHRHAVSPGRLAR